VQDSHHARFVTDKQTNVVIDYSPSMWGGSLKCLCSFDQLS